MPGPVADREALAVELDAAVGGDLAEAQLAQQDVQPALAGDRAERAPVPGWPGSSLSMRRWKSCQTSTQVEPGPDGLPPDRLAALQAVGLRRRSRAPGSRRRIPAEQVGGQQAADDLHGAEARSCGAPCPAGRRRRRGRRPVSAARTAIWRRARWPPASRTRRCDSRSRLARRRRRCPGAREQAGQVVDRALGEVDGLVRRDVAARARRRAGPATSAAASHSALVGPAPVGEHLGVLGDDLAPSSRPGSSTCIRNRTSSSVVRRGTAAVRITPQRRAGRSIGGMDGSSALPGRSGRSRRRSGRCGPGRPSRGGTGRSRKNGSGSACPGTSASRRPAGSAAVATRESVRRLGDVGVQGAQRLGGEGRDLGGGAEAGPHLGQLAGDLVGLDAGLGVLGARLRSRSAALSQSRCRSVAAFQAEPVEGELLAG